MLYTLDCCWNLTFKKLKKFKLWNPWGPIYESDLTDVIFLHAMSLYDKALDPIIGMYCGCAWGERNT